MNAAVFCLAGPDHEVAGCRTLVGPSANAGSLVGGVRVSNTLGLYPTHRQVNPDPGFSARLLADRSGSWSLAAWPGIRELVSLCWWGQGPVPDTAAYGFQGAQMVALAC